MWALSAHGTSVEFQRAVRRARLSAYFKATARELSLEEFVRRIFPNASAADDSKMKRWVSWRKARRLLIETTFSAAEEELNQLFGFLQADCNGDISITDLISAQLLSQEEVLAVLPASCGSLLRYEQYKKSVEPILVAKYASEEDRCKYMGFGPTEDWEESEIARPAKDRLLRNRFRISFTSSDVDATEFEAKPPSKTFPQAEQEATTEEVSTPGSESLVQPLSLALVMQARMWGKRSGKSTDISRPAEPVSSSNTVVVGS